MCGFGGDGGGVARGKENTTLWGTHTVYYYQRVYNDKPQIGIGIDQTRFGSAAAAAGVRQQTGTGIRLPNNSKRSQHFSTRTTHFFLEY